MSDAYRVLPLDNRVGDVAGLRLAAAAICVLAVIWLALTSPPVWALFVIPLGLAAAFFWVRRFLLARASLQAEVREHLDLRSDGFHRVTREGAEVFMWERVAGVEVDEDRVALRIDLGDEDEPVWVEPIYGGLGLYELEAAFRAAREASPSYGA